MAVDSVVFVTGNLNKLAVARQHLAPFGIEVEHVVLDLDEIQAPTVREVALHKARQAFSALRRPLIVEDSGFYIDELNFPGPFVKHVVAMMGVERLARVADVTRDRRCHFDSVLVHVDEAGQETVFEDRASTGTLAATPVGQPQPGSWSAIWHIYIPDGYDRPASALTPEENERRFEQWGTRSVYRQVGEALARSR
jgi:XTP/dITP diphosphohydrolase